MQSSGLIKLIYIFKTSVLVDKTTCGHLDFLKGVLFSSIQKPDFWKEKKQAIIAAKKSIWDQFKRCLTNRSLQEILCEESLFNSLLVEFQRDLSLVKCYLISSLMIW